MFSSQRRPSIKPKTTTTTTTTSSPSSIKTTTTSNNAIASTSNFNSTSSPRPVIKVSTIKRTVVIKKVVQAPPIPNARILASQVASLKRKAEEQEEIERLARVKRLANQQGKERKKERVNDEFSAEEEVEEEESEDSSDDDEETLAAKDQEKEAEYERMRKLENPVVVDRNVSALEDVDPTVECISGEILVKNNMSAYVEHFIDIADPTRSTLEWSGFEIPTIVLEYPGVGASERILLLKPKDEGEEYDPIEDVITTIRLVLDFFLTSSQSLSLFGHTLSTNSFSAFLSAPPSRDTTPATPTDSSLLSQQQSSSTEVIKETLPPLMRALERARSKKDGVTFLASIERYNTIIKKLKEDGTIKENIKEMKGVKEGVWKKIIAQCYERGVGPEIEDLKRYEAFSDNVYGELLPRFCSEIFQQTSLGPNSVFVDLGSGVGNCVVQAALATGCESWGFENMAHASLLARTQVIEAETRFKMWGLNSGAMKVVEADFCDNLEATSVIRRADVVLVNNEVFSGGLNNKLALLFLDLPSSAKIVSLKAFASSFTLSAFNRHSPLAILNQGPALNYSRNSVSWKDVGGTYFIAKVDRNKVEKWDAKQKIKKAKREEKARLEKEKEKEKEVGLEKKKVEGV